MSVESSPSNKKHRVIGWKPEDADTASTARRPWPRWAVITCWVLGVFLVWRTGKFAWDVAHEPSQPQAVVTTGAAGTPSPSQAFADRSQAEFARGDAMRSLETVQKATPDHPKVMDYLITIDRLRTGADKALADRNFPLAVQLYGNVKSEAASFAQLLEDRRKAREGYDKFLVSVSRMERFKALEPDAFTRAITAAGAGQTFLDSGSFTQAREKIDEANTTLIELEQSIGFELQDNLAIGRAALTNGDVRAAELAFGRALELEEKNELAAKGLARAKIIGGVFASLKEARRLEAAGQLEDAQKLYEKTFATDPQSATAQAGIGRLKNAIKTRDLNAALANAEKARTAGKWDEVIAAYEAALKVVPDSKDIQKQLADAKVLQRETRVQNMLASAYDFERDYNWDAAKRNYLDLIAYEPGQADAEEGLLRTGKVIRALLVFEKKIEEARSQVQRANFQLAIAAFNEAMASKPSYLELTPEQTQLKGILERQSKPVQVTFRSDTKTYVTISGVRMLNKFEVVTVPLLPGNYEIIGRRKGYEEVHERLQVRADDPIPPITIIATKKN